jgi:glycosyltransferase involved in cell wall biosynthesis
MGSALRPAAERRPVVIVVFRYVHHYRARFYELLREELDARGVELRLIAGQPSAAELAKDDAVTLPWARAIHNRYLTVAGRELVWQPAFGMTRGADMVIVEQASRLLLNYALLLGRETGGPRVAFWGHGHNIQPHLASEPAEAVKRWASRRVDWWFAYNERSVEVVRELGVAPYRITCVQNAVDTTALIEARACMSEDDLAAARARFGVDSGHVAVFAGALYPDKRLDFLIAAADLVRERVPDFELLIVGAGPDAASVRPAATSRPWLHITGPLYDVDKVAAMSLARCLTLPGLVGLAILDGFALGLPLVTTSVPYHSHEVAYLKPGVNGLLSPNPEDLGAYAAAVVSLMEDDTLLDRLRRGCREAAGKYTVEAMAHNFAEGVVQALNDFSVRP